MRKYIEHLIEYIAPNVPKNVLLRVELSTNTTPMNSFGKNRYVNKIKHFLKMVLFGFQYQKYPKIYLKMSMILKSKTIILSRYKIPLSITVRTYQPPDWAKVWKRAAEHEAVYCGKSKDC